MAHTPVMSSAVLLPRGPISLRDLLYMAKGSDINSLKRFYTASMKDETTYVVL